jgi:hypothetical protein
MLGHASAAMTLDVYAGLFDDDLPGLAARTDAAQEAAASLVGVCGRGPALTAKHHNRRSGRWARGDRTHSPPSSFR